MRLIPARIGDSGEDVSWAQQVLGIAPATGQFDRSTEARLKGFQWAIGIKVTGMLDPKTVEELRIQELR